MEELKIRNGYLRVVRLPDSLLLKTVDDPLKIAEIGSDQDPLKVQPYEEFDPIADKKAS